MKSQWISSEALCWLAHSSVFLTVHPACLSLFLSLCSSLCLGFFHCGHFLRRSHHHPSPLLLHSFHRRPIILQLPHVPKMKLNIWVKAHTYTTFSFKVSITVSHHISVLLFSGEPERQCTSSTRRYCSNTMGIDRSRCKSNQSPTFWLNHCLGEKKRCWEIGSHSLIIVH